MLRANFTSPSLPACMYLTASASAAFERFCVPPWQMRPRLHRPDRRQRMPMVRRRHKHGGDGFVIENPAQILDGFGFRALLPGENAGEFSRAIAVRVANVRDLAVGKLGEFGCMLLAANAA